MSISFLQGCKKDLTATFSEIQPKEIHIQYYVIDPPITASHYSSNYKFKYGANGMLDSVTLKGIQSLESSNTGSEDPRVLLVRYPLDRYELTKGGQNPNNFDYDYRYMIADERYRVLEAQYRSQDGLGWSGCHNVFHYSDNKLKRIDQKDEVHYGHGIDSVYNIGYSGNLLTSFTQKILNEDSTKTYTVEYQNSSPDEDVINVNGMNNLFFCIPFEVQGVLPFLAVDNRFSLSGIAMHNLISGFSIAETRNGIATITRHFDVVYNYDSEGRITKITYVNSANLANYRVIDISY